MQRSSDIAEEVEQREQLVAFPLEGVDAALEAGELVRYRGRESCQVSGLD